MQSLGFADVANLLLEVNRLFQNESPPIDIIKRNEIISSWSDDDIDNEIEDFFARLDKHFYSREKALEKALVHHIQNKLLVG